MTDLGYRILRDFSDSLGSGEDTLLRAVCMARGCVENQCAEFIDQQPPIHNPIKQLAAYGSFLSCLRILPQKGTILIYGDYDCDGITSSVIVHDLLLALYVQEERIRHFIPDRFKDGYGLTEKGWQSALKANGDPALLITVDCGTPSGDLINKFKFPTLIIDHHDFDNPGNAHPAKAHLNPKAEDSEAAKQLKNCCAAGLAFLLAEAAVQDLDNKNWNRERALILGGLGTLVDVMKLIGVNRALVKHSLKLANLSNLSVNVPGLAALKIAADTKRVDSEAYGFQWGPRINACGRLMDASPALNLLLAQDEDKAVTISKEIEAHFRGLKGGEVDQDSAAKTLSAVNEKRKAVQKVVLEQAMAQAEDKLSQEPKPKVLVLYHESWHAGVIGIVAARVRESTHRPTIVLGKQPEPNGPWKGSGRSIPEYDLGAGIRAAVGQGILMVGGGHPMAAGMSAETDEKIGDLQKFINEHCTLEESTFTPAYEVLGSINGRSSKDWWTIREKLHPFGQGNPPLYFKLENGKLSEINVLGDSGEWVLLTVKIDREDFRIKAPVDKAASLSIGGNLSGILSLSQSVKDATQVFYNWTLEAIKLDSP